MIHPSSARLRQGYVGHLLPQGEKEGSHIQRRIRRIVLDELAPRFDDPAHRLGKRVIGFVDFYNATRALAKNVRTLSFGTTLRRIAL